MLDCYNQFVAQAKGRKLNEMSRDFRLKYVGRLLQNAIIEA